MRIPLLPLWFLLGIALSSCAAAGPVSSPLGGASSSVGAPSASSSSGVALFLFPLPDGAQRVTKKPFGIFVTPGQSPVQPERFRGFHTGTDFETFPDEKDRDVSVQAICGGSILFAGWVKGYGGVLVQSCSSEGGPVTVLYGHLHAERFAVAKGDRIVPGQGIGVLGKGYSAETDGERKHLHLAVHRGPSIDFLGYVRKPEELQMWINAYP